MRLQPSLHAPWYHRRGHSGHGHLRLRTVSWNGPFWSARRVLCPRQRAKQVQHSGLLRGAIGRLLHSLLVRPLRCLPRVQGTDPANPAGCVNEQFKIATVGGQRRWFTADAKSLGDMDKLPGSTNHDMNRCARRVHWVHRSACACYPRAHGDAISAICTPPPHGSLHKMRSAVFGYPLTLVDEPPTLPNA